jgi:hypothetical protein
MGGPAQSISTFSFFNFLNQKNQAQQLGERRKRRVGSLLGPSVLFLIIFSTPEILFLFSFLFHSQKLCWPLSLFVRGFQQQKRIPNKSLTDLVFLFRFLLLLASTPNFQKKKQKFSFF